MKDNIALIGFMGSGKTTVGKFLAKTMDNENVAKNKKTKNAEKRIAAKIGILLLDAFIR